MNHLALLPVVVLLMVGSAGSVVQATNGEARSPTAPVFPTSQVARTSDSLPPLPPAETFLPEPPTYPSFNSQRLDQQLQLYTDYLWRFGAPDLLIVGSSRALQGVDPDVLRQALAEQGYPDLKVYNFSINGATAQVIDLVLRQILLPEHLPEVLIWADGSRAFNSGRLDVTYNGILASEGFKRLATGDRPLPSIAENEDLLTSLDVPPQPGNSALNALGFEAIPDRFDPATYYQQNPRVPGAYDTNYVPFRLDGAQTEATIAIARFAQSQNIPLAFINLPLTQEYLDPARRDYEQRFRQHMQRLAAQEQFIFRDLSQRWLTQNHYFADPSHLNQEGARAVAMELAADAEMPWDVLLNSLQSQSRNKDSNARQKYTAQ